MNIFIFNSPDQSNSAFARLSERAVVTKLCPQDSHGFYAGVLWKKLLSPFHHPHLTYRNSVFETP
jgi:hypothetical protein